MSKAITADPTDTAAPANDSCPDCGAALANVQGIDACVGCRYTED